VFYAEVFEGEFVTLGVDGGFDEFRELADFINCLGLLEFDETCGILVYFEPLIEVRWL